MKKTKNFRSLMLAVIIQLQRELKQKRKIEMKTQIGTHATKITSDRDYAIIRYHDTDVVKLNQSEVILNSGGFRTATTKRRMNQVSKAFDLGYQVYQKNFVWYVSYQGKEILFKDGMILSR